jgi:glutamate 5-kinase
MTSPLQQKLKIVGPVVVTANRVADGAVVYRGEGGWTTKLDAAAVTTSAAVAQDLLGAAKADGLHAVDAYVAPVQVSEDGRVRPGNLRERIRSSGPTIELPPQAVKVQADHVSVR